jgi:diaminohydroxyphosphoribosylaminopyrimidine deaminase / 5-amino-6-(5-phosphoribosylamino)uracil reductase
MAAPSGAGPSAAEDAAFMRSALALAARGLGRSAPNPAVGCVIVNGGRVVGRGWTQPGGRPHAEAVALAQAGDAARGAAAYVTLEPCAHHGRTPPCTDALIAHGLARVAIPLIDPDPRVSGRGVAALREAGVRVDVGCMAAEAAHLNRGFFQRVATGRPLVTLKLAQSLDGRIATAAGESRWITGPLARRETHLARARADAVLIGGGTARADDPMLDVRGIGLQEAAPIRVVAAAALDLPVDGRLGRSARAIPLWLCPGPGVTGARRDAWRAAGADLIETPHRADGGLDLAGLLSRLGGRGLTRVFCEGGSRLAASLIAADLADEIVVYCAGLVLGGDGLASVGPLRLPALAAAPRYALASSRPVGGDLRMAWRRAAPGDG